MFHSQRCQLCERTKLCRNSPRQLVVIKKPARTITKQTRVRKVKTYQQDWNSKGVVLRYVCWLSSVVLSAWRQIACHLIDYFKASSAKIVFL